MSRLIFRSLSNRLRQSVGAKIVRGMTAAFRRGGYYEVVEGETQAHRARSRVETAGEDGILPARDRARMINLFRNAMRNAPTAQTVVQQRRVNVVGLVGGKLTMTFTDPHAQELARPWEDWFNQEWAPQAEFTDGLHFNEALKLTLASKDSGGDVVLLFDDGLLCNSGRIRAFEADEIASIPDEDFKKRFGKKYRQSQGRISDAYGRTVGVIVSHSQRGEPVFDPSAAFVLMSDPLVDRRECYWTMIRSVWRFNQGRGVSPMASALGTLIDIHEVVASETQSAKMNSKLVGQLLDNSDLATDSSVSADYSPTDPDEEESGGSDTGADGSASEAVPQNLSLRELDSIGTIFDLMPPKMRLELLDTKRPNPNMPQFIDWLVGSVTGVFGAGRMYATLNPDQSYTAFRGAQSMARPSFEESSKDLERYVCDWAVRNAFRWALREKKVTTPLPEGWQRSLSWSWPSMADINEVDAQTALDKKLANYTETYREVLGPRWQERLDQVALEKEYFRKKGLVHPSEITPSGAVVPQKQKEGSDD